MKNINKRYTVDFSNSRHSIIWTVKKSVLYLSWKAQFSFVLLFLLLYHSFQLKKKITNYNFLFSHRNIFKMIKYLYDILIQYLYSTFIFIVNKINGFLILKWSYFFYKILCLLISIWIITNHSQLTYSYSELHLKPHDTYGPPYFSLTLLYILSFPLLFLFFVVV